LIEGVDYLICPESNARLLIIRGDYITQVLGLTVEEYTVKYPNVSRRCQAHSNNIKSGLHSIDSSTGLTKYKIGQIKARAKLKEIDETGKSGYKRKGEKTRQTHLSRIDEFGRHGYQRQVLHRLTTILDNGLTVEQNAHIKQKEKLIKNKKSGTGGASEISKKILSPIVQFLVDNEIKFYFDKNEYGLKDPTDKNFYFWDLVIPQWSMAIEYQSRAWHANPVLSETNWNNWKTPRGQIKTAQQVLEYDYKKARSLFKNRKIMTYYVWEASQNKDVEDILCLLKTLNMK
jgi:hypothetical protein